MTRRAAALVLALLMGGCPEGDTPGVKLAPDAGGGATAPTAAALLEVAKGPVTIERGGKKLKAELGYLYLKDAIETGEDGEARVRFPGGRVIELGPEGRFELREGEGGLVLSVAQGLVLTRNASDQPAQPLPGPSVKLTILTPFGFTKVEGVDDLNLTLTVNDQGAKVDVKLGAIDLVGNDGKVTKIGAGEKAQLGKPRELQLEPIQVTISAIGGKVELKKKDDAKWVLISGKKATALGEGDSFRVKDGRTVMQAPGGQGTLTFSRGSEVTMEKAAKGTGEEEAGFDFKKGELQASSPVKSRLNLGGGVTLSAEQASQFTLKRTKDGYELQSTAGDVKVEREGAAPETVFGGRTAVIPVKGAVKSDDPSRESIVLPTRSALKVFHSNAGRFAITWDGESDKAYRVEVASDNAYKQKVISGVVHQRFVNVAVPNRGSLYWRVFGEDGKEVAKGSASFAPEPNTTDLARNKNEVPEGTEKTTIFFQDKPPRVTFTWAEDAEAARYKVAVYREGQLGKPVLEKVTQTPQFPTDEGALGEGKYLWNVTPLDAKGAEVRGGKMNKLEITYDNAVPNLTIKAPRNGDAGGAKVRCSGIAPVGAKVTVNGKPLQLDEKSRFDTEVAPMGSGLLVFRMVNGPSEVYTVRKVRKGK